MLRVVAVLALAATAAGFASTVTPDGSFQVCRAGPDSPDTEVRAFARALGLPEMSCHQVPGATILVTATRVYGGCSVFRNVCPRTCSAHGSCTGVSGVQGECPPEGPQFVEGECTAYSASCCQELACHHQQSPERIAVMKVNCCTDSCMPPPLEIGYGREAQGPPSMPPPPTLAEIINCSSITLCNDPLPLPSPPPPAPPAPCGLVQPWMEGREALNSEKARVHNRCTHGHAHTRTRAHALTRSHAHTRTRFPSQPAHSSHRPLMTRHLSLTLMMTAAMARPAWKWSSTPQIRVRPRQVCTASTRRIKSTRSATAPAASPPL